MMCNVCNVMYTVKGLDMLVGLGVTVFTFTKLKLLITEKKNIQLFVQWLFMTLYSSRTAFWQVKSNNKLSGYNMISNPLTATDWWWQLPTWWTPRRSWSYHTDSLWLNHHWISRSNAGRHYPSVLVFWNVDCDGSTTACETAGPQVLHYGEPYRTQRGQSQRFNLHTSNYRYIFMVCHQ